MRNTGIAVAMTQPHGENAALTHLANQSFTAFAPKFVERIMKAGRRIERTGFLFSRYVFVWLDEHSRWRSINGTKGVQRLITQDEKPVLLSFQDEARIMDMKRQCDEHGLIDMSEVVETRKKGDPVKALFAGAIHDGVWYGRTKADREIVLLQMLGRAVKVEVPSEALV